MVNWESKNLTAKHTQEQKAAGIEKFSRFGVKNLLDALAGGDVLKYESIMLLPYKLVTEKLLMFKVENEYHKKLNEIMFPKPRKK